MEVVQLDDPLEAALVAEEEAAETSGTLRLQPAVTAVPRALVPGGPPGTVPGHPRLPVISAK